MILEDAFAYIEPVKRLFESAQEDLARMDAVVPVREQTTGAADSFTSSMDVAPTNGRFE